jgi:hypothetical protein
MDERNHRSAFTEAMINYCLAGIMISVLLLAFDCLMLSRQLSGGYS